MSASRALSGHARPEPRRVLQDEPRLLAAIPAVEQACPPQDTENTLAVLGVIAEHWDGGPLVGVTHPAEDLVLGNGHADLGAEQLPQRTQPLANVPGHRMALDDLEDVTVP